MARHVPITDIKNYPKGENKPDYPAMPVVTKPRLTTNDPAQPNAPSYADAGKSMEGRSQELPLGKEVNDIATPQHNQGIQQAGRRDSNPVETPETLSSRGGYAQSDLSQKKVMEKNDPTHDDKSYSNRSWEDSNFENRRKFY